MINKSVLICGRSGTGKSTCLRGLRDPEGVMYLNCEGKPLPFNSKFKEYSIEEPEQVFEALTAVNSMANIHTVVIDSLTFLMDMYETKRVNTASNTQKGWGEYGAFLKSLCLDFLKKCTKNVIVLAHTGTRYNEQDLVQETKVSIKGSVGKTNGVESYFTTVIYTKVLPIDKLSPNALLSITSKEERRGCKYVFQTDKTKETGNESMKAPDGLFSDDEVFIDNNAQYILDKLGEFYKETK